MYPRKTASSGWQKYLILKARWAPSGLAAKWAAFTKMSTVTYSDCDGITDMASRMRSAFIEVEDLNVLIKDVLLLTLFNNLGLDRSQYRAHNLLGFSDKPLI